MAYAPTLMRSASPIPGGTIPPWAQYPQQGTGVVPGTGVQAPSTPQAASAVTPAGVNGTTSYAAPSSGNPLSWVSGSQVTQAATPAPYSAAQAQQVAPYSAALASQVAPYQVAQASNAPTPAAYAQALQTALAPEFQQNQANLNAQQAAMGTLTSGAGNYGDQLLTSQNNATYANALLPLIQQGYSQDATASLANAAAANSAQAQAQSLNANIGTQNAGSINSALGQATGLNAGIGTSNASAINNALSQIYGTQANTNLANATAQNSSANNYASALNNYLAQLQSQGFQAGQNNQSAQNQFALAQMGYGNEAYQQALAAELGLNSTGLAQQGNILASGTGQLYNGYQNALGQATQAGQSTGYSYSPYATGTGQGDLGNSSFGTYTGSADTPDVNNSSFGGYGDSTVQYA